MHDEGAVLGILSPWNGELGRALERQHCAHSAGVEVGVDPADFNHDLLLLSCVAVPKPLVARIRSLAVRVVRWLGRRRPRPSEVDVLQAAARHHLRYLVQAAL